MWTYHQKNGLLQDLNGEQVAYGYAGKGEGKNNPDLQERHQIGPLPRGLYTIQAPIDTEKHGPYVLALVPDAKNEMFDRGDFRIHGDNKNFPGTASEGCMIFSLLVRKKIWNSGDRLLEVTL